MSRFLCLISAAALLAACAQPAPPPASPVAQQEAPQPSEAMEETFSACTWGEVKGASLSIWSYACENDLLIADETVPGFVRETRDPSGKVIRSTVIQVFTKPADAPIDAILPAVRAASPGAETCEITPGSHGDHVLMPTGAAADAYAKFIEGKADGPDMPCGPLGPSEGGGRTFRQLKDAPDKVVMISWPSDVPIFDPDTLRVIASTSN